MLAWWLTESVPIFVTALLPLVLLPVLGVLPLREAAAQYGNELVFLFLAGFVLAAGLERWRAHERIAYRIVVAVGLGPRRVVLAMMLATAVVSMWISNTATTAMMYPIALAIAALLPPGRDGERVRTALMLGVAYAASLGGMATPIGSPPNLVTLAAIRELTGTPVTFGGFMAVGLPIVALLVPCCWVLLSWVVFPARLALPSGAGAEVRARLAALGPVVRGERAVFAVFLGTAAAWILREPKDLGGLRLPGLTDLVPALTDTGVGLAGALLLFLLPTRTAEGARRPLLTWHEARTIPWEVLFFFGGGLALARALEATGTADLLTSQMTRLAGAPPVLVWLALALLVTVLSELASNLAVAAMAMPLAHALALAAGLDPRATMLVAGFAASCGFALPVATPPNALVFGSGHLRVRDMAVAGVLLDLLAVAGIVGVVALL